MKISTKLILLLITTVVSVMGVYALVTISRTQDLLTEELQKMAEHIGMALSVGTLHHLEENDLAGVSRVLETISRNQDVMGAAIFDRAGELVAVSHSMAPAAAGQRQAYPSEEGGGEFREENGRRVYLYVTGIQNTEGQPVGSLRLALYEWSMLPYVLQSRNHILITIAALTAILSTLVVYVSRKQIAEPLQKLAGEAEAIGQGDLSRRVEIGGEGEIGALAGAFNRMVANLEASNREIIAEREHIRSIVDSIPEGIVVLDRNRRIMAWNRTMAQRYELRLEQVLGREVSEVLPSLPSDGLKNRIDALLAGECSGFEIREMILEITPNRVKTVMGSPLQSIDGQAGVVLVLLDVTERMRLERQVQQSEKLAAIGQLAAGLAHEIGTPLNVISGSAEYLLMDVEDGRTGELRTIVEEVGRITDLVKRLMALARQGKSRIESVEVKAWIDSVLSLMQRQIEKQGIQVRVDLAPDLPDVMGDRDQLQQVLLNLVMNAWQAMPEGGQLTVEARRYRDAGGADRTSPERLELTVSDTGEGIPEAHIQRIFDPFFTTKEVGAGTGLGLAIVHRIVENHGGEISVASREDAGTSFRVLLPVEREV